MENNPAVKWVLRHPRISAWVVLATGMVALLVHEARAVGLLPSQWVALIVATVLVAGACIWIISWGPMSALPMQWLKNQLPRRQRPKAPPRPGSHDTTGGLSEFCDTLSPTPRPSAYGS
ncbi:MAG: hypothetical protein J4G18_12720 [Anaerolineae bacterium]|nr:hypothetical protein [Anaerolineae bacterium]